MVLYVGVGEGDACNSKSPIKMETRWQVGRSRNLQSTRAALMPQSSFHACVCQSRVKELLYKPSPGFFLKPPEWISGTRSRTGQSGYIGSIFLRLVFTL
jgi:hypothetical protein